MKELKFEFLYRGMPFSAENTERHWFKKIYTLVQLVDKSVADMSDVHSFSELIAMRQFTGLTDKNGVDIYDGDILSAPFANGEYAKNIKHKIFNVAVTITPENGASMNFPKDAWRGNYRWYPHFIECEVIGNIHQNPELLENKNG